MDVDAECGTRFEEWTNLKGIILVERERTIAGKTFISGIIAGLPGADAGLLMGDEILDVDGKTFEPVGSFTGKVGQPVVMSIRRTAAGGLTPVTLKPEWIHPADAFEEFLTLPAYGLLD